MKDQSLALSDDEVKVRVVPASNDIDSVSVSIEFRGKFFVERFRYAIDKKLLSTDDESD